MVSPAGIPEKPRGWFARWMRQPQSTWLRKATFQLHLWSGMLLGVYVVVVCVSGSALVFRNDLYTLFENWERAGTVSQNSALIKAFYVAFRWLGDIHGRLLLGVNGMLINAIGGFLTAAICVTGLVIWWPGIFRWRRGLFVKGLFTGEVGWKRFNFDLHSAVGFWTFGLLFIWGVTGGYFVFPQPFRAVINYFTPIDAPLVPQRVIVADTVQSGSALPGNSPAGAARGVSPASSATPNAAPAPKTQGARAGGAKSSVSESGAVRSASAAPASPSPFPRRRRRPLTKGGKILQWFSFLHYGNFAGWIVKTIWLVMGLSPAILFGTAVVMWWNRVLSPSLKRWRAYTAPSGQAIPELELKQD